MRKHFCVLIYADLSVCLFFQVVKTAGYDVETLILLTMAQASIITIQNKDAER